MSEEIIFHLVTKSDWREHQNRGLYRPESLEEEGFIHCSTGSQVQETANRYYSGQRGVLLLVINTNQVAPEIKYEESEERGEAFPHIYGPLNTDAILDKIKLQPDDEGHFEIDYSAS